MPRLKYLRNCGSNLDPETRDQRFSFHRALIVPSFSSLILSLVSPADISKKEKEKEKDLENGEETGISTINRAFRRVFVALVRDPPGGQGAS